MSDLANMAYFWLGKDKELMEACVSCSAQLHQRKMLTVLLEFKLPQIGKVVIYRIAYGHTLEECQRTIESDNMHQAVN